MFSFYYVMQYFAFKKKETIFDNITDKLSVTQMLRTLLKHDFPDVEIFIIQDFIVLF